MLWQHSKKRLLLMTRLSPIQWGPFITMVGQSTEPNQFELDFHGKTGLLPWKMI